MPDPVNNDDFGWFSAFLLSFTEGKEAMTSALQSKVPGHEGLCRPTWLNRNQVCIRFDGRTGFFRAIKSWGPFSWRTGPEFHGLITQQGTVVSTGTKDTCV